MPSQYSSGNLFIQCLWPPLRTPNAAANQMAWLSLLRWASILTQSLILWGAHRLEFLSDAFLPIGLVLVLIQVFLNGLYILDIHIQPQKITIVSIFGALSIDFVIFILLLSFTQGIHNPFYPLIYLFAMLAALLLPPTLSLIFVCLMGFSIYLLNPVIYVFDSYGTYVRLAALHTLGIQSIVLIAIWALINGLTRQSQTYKKRWQAAQDKAQRLKQVKLLEALGSGFSHELATPLNTLKICLDAQLQSPTSDHLVRAQQALKQCEVALKGLANLPRLHEMKSKPIQAQSFIKNMGLKWMKNNPQSPEIHFEFRLPEERYLSVPPKLFEQSLFNLWDNAFYSGTDKIRCLIYTESQSLVIEIQDTGEGWPESVKKHIGEPFISTRSQGTGLGLYTVYVMIEALGGHLELKDNTPKGAIVKLCLPSL